MDCDYCGNDCEEMCESARDEREEQGARAEQDRHATEEAAEEAADRDYRAGYWGHDAANARAAVTGDSRARRRS